MKTRTMILCALFAALTAVGAFFKIPFALAAISLQFLFTAMAGVLLGAGYGALSQAVYVLLAVLYAIGVPYMALIANGYLGKGLTFWQVIRRGMLIYLPGDLLKITLGSLLCVAITRRMPAMFALPQKKSA